MQTNRIPGAARGIGAPVIASDCKVKDPGIVACEVKIDHAAKLLPIKEHIVAKEVGVNG
ncbi:MAG: hypothetical protein RLZZ613_1864 [Pseudomonadota bacterium]